MKILLDTHALLWFIDGDSRLPERIIKCIKNPNNHCYISIASLWEISIKMSLGKITINGKFKDFTTKLLKNKFEVLPISFEHLEYLLSLEFHHRDPFDRLIISQCMVEKLTLISKDRLFADYKLDILWD